MIDTKELRFAASKSIRDLAIMPSEVIELLDRLEAAESDALEQARLNGMGSEREAALMAKLEAAEKERDNANSAAVGIALQAKKLQAERDALRAKITEMERQEPVTLDHLACVDNGVLRFMTGRKAPAHDCELYAMPNGKAAPKLYALPGAQPAPSLASSDVSLISEGKTQPAPSAPDLDMDYLERQNDELKEEVGKLRDALVLIADQYEPKCHLLIPSIARTALNATGAYGQKEPPESWPTEAMVTAFAELFNVRDQKNTFGRAFRAALAAAPEGKP